MPICNTTLEYPGDLGELLLVSPYLKFDEVRERGSGNAKRYQTSEKYRDFSFTIYPKTGKVIMKGSWAKFHNDGQHNYTRYTVTDFVEDINWLSQLFGYEFSRGIIHGVEAGVNLNLAGLPQPYFSPDYLLSRLICYQGRLPFLPMKTIRGSGNGVECSLTNYRIKAYDKGTQYHRPEPLLRFEYDCNQAKELLPLDIRRLADLTNPDKLHLLGKKVRGFLADSILIEPVYVASLSIVERRLYERAERPSFWRDLTRRNRAYYLKSFRDLVKTYSQYRLHSRLCEMVKKEWSILTENCNVFPGLTTAIPSMKGADDCNIFLPINYRKCYHGWPQIGASTFDLLSTPVTVVEDAILPSSVEAMFGNERRCEVTGVVLDEAQPKGSKVVGITTLRKNPDIMDKLRQKYGRKQCKRDYHTEEYHLAHGPRNEKSNKPNNLRRRVNQSINNTLLFAPSDVIRLTTEQLATLSYFDGTPYQMKFP